MKKIFFALVAVLLMANTGFAQTTITKTASETAPQGTFTLFGVIAVNIDKSGNYSFADPAKAKIQIEDIFIKQSGALKTILTYGFGKDAAGVAGFYIVEKRDDGKFHRFTFFLDNSHYPPGAKFVSAGDCCYDDCCKGCVSHSSLGCTCSENDHSPGCAGGSCSSGLTPITIKF